MVSPGLSNPCCSAFSIMYQAMRALIEPDGFMNSSLAKTPSISSSGVSPMASRIEREIPAWRMGGLRRGGARIIRPARNARLGASSMTQATAMPTPDNARLDRIVAEARRAAEQRGHGYRERALKMYPWICGRCAREFTRANLHELTVHHRNHN